MDRLFPDAIGVEADEQHITAAHLEAASWTPVASRATGYIQSVNADALFELACAQRAVIRMERAIGEFVIEGGCARFSGRRRPGRPILR